MERDRELLTNPTSRVACSDPSWPLILFDIRTQTPLLCVLVTEAHLYSTRLAGKTMLAKLCIASHLCLHLIGRVLRPVSVIRQRAPTGSRRPAHLLRYNALIFEPGEIFLGLPVPDTVRGEQ
jgi:hypothetical protein